MGDLLGEDDALARLIMRPIVAAWRRNGLKVSSAAR